MTIVETLAMGLTFIENHSFTDIVNYFIVHYLHKLPHIPETNAVDPARMTLEVLDMGEGLDFIFRNVLFQELIRFLDEDLFIRVQTIDDCGLQTAVRRQSEVDFFG